MAQLSEESLAAGGYSGGKVDELYIHVKVDNCEWISRKAVRTGLADSMHTSDSLSPNCLVHAESPRKPSFVINWPINSFIYVLHLTLNCSHKGLDHIMSRDSLRPHSY